MNILLQAQRCLAHQPVDYGVKGNETAFSSSVEALNSHPLAGLQSYEQYVKKDETGVWSKRREIYRQYYGWCQRCHQRKGTQLHHLSYKNLGREEIAGEVEWICGACHLSEHTKTPKMEPPKDQTKQIMIDIENL